MTLDLNRPSAQQELRPPETLRHSAQQELPSAQQELRPPQAPADRQRRRRGIVLLMVVSLLALFILLGITFTLVATHYHHASRLEARHQRHGDPPETEMDLILGQILYDTPARTSLQYHSLLRDLYGYDGNLASDPINDPNFSTNVTTAIYRETFVGRVEGPSSGGSPMTSVGVGQLYSFQFKVPAKFNENPTALSQSPGYYAGRVITFLSGVAANHSTRIVAYSPINPTAVPATGQFVIEAIESKLSGSITALIADEDQFVVNGAPFNGAGPGYDMSTYNIDQDLVAPDPMGNPLLGTKVALQPHYAAYRGNLTYTGTAGSFIGGLRRSIDMGGVDEPWDAPDLHNFWLAMVPPRMAETYYSNRLPIIPSFHRPELVNYWFNNPPSDRMPLQPLAYVSDNTNDNSGNHALAAPHRDFVRTFVMRPMPWDHPNFTGSNPYFMGQFATPANGGALLNGGELLNALLGKDSFGNNIATWDVDNDNDGIPDSIWIDPGLPVMTAPDGRRYKRLCAILIKDLDGRFDLNAHGNLAEVATDYSVNLFLATTDVQLGLMQSLAKLPRGLGFGPAEVTFYHLLGNDQTAYRSAMQARYGSGHSGETPWRGLPGLPSVRDALAVIKHNGIPNNYANLFNYANFTGGLPLNSNAYNEPSWYSSPPDVWGRGVIVLDVGGQPITNYMAANGEMIDTPYEMTLRGEANGTDTPFTPADLERLYRHHDRDAQSLHSRLLDATNVSTYLASLPPGVINPSTGGLGGPPGEHAKREMLGMTSHLPVTSMLVPRERRSIDNIALGSASILNLYRARLSANMPSATAAQINQEMRKIVPWEFFKGQKFDLNRWLGDGVDNNGDGVRDNASLHRTLMHQKNEAMVTTPPASVETGWQGSTASPSLSALPAAFTGPVNADAHHANGVDANNDNMISVLDDGMARQLYARHLFCLALLLTDNGFNPPLTADTPWPAPPPPSPSAEYELKIQRLAQWAINVVDFRDSDAIMTPFEYDVNPWNGWDVDGNLFTDGSMGAPEIVNGAPKQTDERRLVWGVEYPDLLLTETVAFHDKRVKDTENDNDTGKRVGPGMNDDEDVDQFRIPQGSLFIELYCPRNRQTRNPVFPPELYSYDSVTQEWRLDLARMSGPSPVWQIAISQQTYGSAALQDRSPLVRSQPGNQPRSTTFLDPSFLDPSGPSGVAYLGFMGAFNTDPLPIERFIWFTDAGPAVTAPVWGGRTYYNRAAWDISLQPGQYAVVGPRTTTYMGSPNTGAVWTPPAPLSSQSIVISALDRRNPASTGVAFTDAVGNPSPYVVPNGIRSVVGIVADMEPPMSGPGVIPWTNANRRVGLNISEPLPQSGFYYPEPNPTGAWQPLDSYADLTDPTMKTLPDKPLDWTTDPLRSQHTPLSAQGNALYRTGSYPDVRSVFLQRLADPSQPWDPVLNPYITIDWASVDLTVFNGEEKLDRNPPPMPDLDPNDVPPASGFVYRFQTRERGEQPPPPTTAPFDSNVWPPRTTSPQTTMATTSGAYFQHSLDNSLGYLNSVLEVPLSGPNAGEPASPFPWMTWNNRPYSSPYELMQVPSGSPSRQLFEFHPVTSNYTAATIAGSPYDSSPGTTQEQNYQLPFRHLLNFFYSGDPAATPRSPELHRIFDYVEVPSPFAGAERWYNPQNFGSVISDTPPANAIPYRPPFNKLSRFRDPGRININTIFDVEIWKGAVGHFPGLDTTAFWDKLTKSRKGKDVNWLQMDNDLPTRFANPFRPADSADLMPNVPAGAGSMRRKRPVEAGFLRPDDPAGANPTSQQPLFEMSWNTPTTDNFRNTERNPYFRYQALQKLGNILTTQSNCFAVWITVGYFEVEPVTVSAAHPDGFTLGQEIGADSGEIKRHRAFYIIDRSVPVGFIPGSRLNTDDCILLSRLIE